MLPVIPFNDLSHKYVQMTLRDRNTKNLCNLFTFVDICQMIIAQKVVQKDLALLFYQGFFFNVAMHSPTA